MTRHYEACGKGEKWDYSWIPSIVLQSKHWEQQQHKPPEGKHYHARFMRPACHSFPLRTLSLTRRLAYRDEEMLKELFNENRRAVNKPEADRMERSKGKRQVTARLGQTGTEQK